MRWEINRAVWMPIPYIKWVCHWILSTISLIFRRIYVNINSENGIYAQAWVLSRNSQGRFRTKTLTGYESMMRKHTLYRMSVLFLNQPTGKLNYWWLEPWFKWSKTIKRQLAIKENQRNVPQFQSENKLIISNIKYLFIFK